MLPDRVARPGSGVRSWGGGRIVAVWLLAIALAVAAVQIGDALRPTRGQATGFYVGSLFVWIIWIAWLVTWRWVAARKSASPAGRWRWMQGLLVFFGLLWLAGTIFEYL